MLDANALVATRWEQQVQLAGERQGRRLQDIVRSSTEYNIHRLLCYMRALRHCKRQAREWRFFHGAL